MPVMNKKDVSSFVQIRNGVGNGALAEVISINDNGRLTVKFSNGHKREVSSDDVSTFRCPKQQFADYKAQLIHKMNEKRGDQIQFLKWSRTLKQLEKQPYYYINSLLNEAEIVYLEKPDPWDNNTYNYPYKSACTIAGGEIVSKSLIKWISEKVCNIVQTKGIYICNNAKYPWLLQKM